MRTKVGFSKIEVENNNYVYNIARYPAYTGFSSFESARAPSAIVCQPKMEIFEVSPLKQLIWWFGAAGFCAYRAKDSPVFFTMDTSKPSKLLHQT